MKTVLATIFTFIVTSTCCQKNDLQERLDYLKSHDIYIVRVAFEHKKLTLAERDSVKSWGNAINKNIRKSVEAFWDLNSSIHFIDADSLKFFKKQYPHDVFLDFKSKYYSLNLKIPKKKRYFIDVSPRLFAGDTSLLAITQEIRQLRYNVIHGSTVYAGPEMKKSFLILDEPALNAYHQKFVDDIKQKFPNSFQMVDRKTLINVIYNNDSNFIYVHRLSLINIEDGSLVPL